jgi:hypothetical protein
MRVPLQHARTVGTAGLRALACTRVGLRHQRLWEAPSALRAQGPHRGRHLRSGCRRLRPRRYACIAPAGTARVALWTQGTPWFACTDRRKHDNLSRSHG